MAMRFEKLRTLKQEFQSGLILEQVQQTLNKNIYFSMSIDKADIKKY